MIIADAGSKSVNSAIVAATTDIVFSIKNIRGFNRTMHNSPTVTDSGPQVAMFDGDFAPAGAGEKVAALKIPNNDASET